MQCGNSDVTVRHTSRKGLTSLPVPRLPHSDVSAAILGGFTPCTETVTRFLPADALWNLAMAINVYMTLFRKYNAQQLKALEWRYHCMVCVFSEKPLHPWDHFRIAQRVLGAKGSWYHLNMSFCACSCPEESILTATP